MATNHFWLLGLIPLLPALGAVFNGLFGRKVPKAVVHTVACGVIAAAFAVSLVSLLELLGTDHGHGPTALTYTAYHWFGAGGIDFDVAFLFDPLSATLCLIITGVGLLIHIYSVGYMSHDPSYSRFFTYLNLFCFAMLVLVLGKNLVLTFVGWEGVGLASYLLIGFWYKDDEKADAGKKAFIMNRIGDAAFLLGMFMLVAFTNTLDVVELRHRITGMEGEALAQFLPFATVIGVLFFIACTGKSAQIPLYTWLPDAMAGPTPVSALIHAATMVTAGVFLVTRLNFVFTLSPTAMAVVATVGALTALFAASIALVQRDIKKVLAYSTVSQLGYMFLAAGSGAYFAAVFHLMTHAFFKALLFLGSGSVIHAMGGKQDIMEMGGLKKWMPVTRITFLLGCLAIAGFPLFSGFFSKDEILWFALTNRHVMGGIALGPFLWAIGILTAGLTAFYMFRLYFLTFEGECRADHHTQEHLHESPASMTWPLVVLAGLSVAGGVVGLPHIWHMPAVLHDFLHSVIVPAPGFGEEAMERAYGYGMAWVSMLVATGVGLTSIYVAWRLYGRPSNTPAELKDQFAPIHKVLENKYYVDEAYDRGVVRPIMRGAQALYTVVDRFLIDTLLVGGVAFLVRGGGLVLRQLQSGDVQRYAFFILFGLTLTLWLIMGMGG
jgi:NADH-quinone oxidoreductase subunit L